MRATAKYALLFSLFSSLIFVACGDDAVDVCDELADADCEEKKDDENGHEITVEPVGHIEDIDGNSYPYIEIDGRHFTAKNLETTHYRNGDEIPQVQDPDEWARLTTGAWAYYENVESNGRTYGKLYNWHAVNDPRGLGPEGWRVPTYSEWTGVSVALGGNATAGGKLKAKGVWTGSSPATDEVGFAALPSGHRDRDGRFSSIRSTANFWSATDYESGIDANARFVSVTYLNTTFGTGFNRQTMGMAIRLVEE